MAERFGKLKAEAETLGVDARLLFHENMQKIILAAIYGDLGLQRLIFHGGTALHLIYGSPRFSLDLDFSGATNDVNIKKLPETVFKKVQRYVKLPDVDAALLQARIQGDEIGKRFLRFAIEFSPKPPLGEIRVKAEVWEREPPQSVGKLMLVEIPVRTAVYIQARPLQGILVDKVCSFSGRTYVAHRDVYDMWFMGARGTELSKRMLLSEFGRWHETLGGLRGKIADLEKELSSDDRLTRFAAEVNRLLPLQSKLTVRTAEEALRSAIGFLRRAEAWLG